MPFINIADGYCEVSVFYNLRSIHDCVNSFGAKSFGTGLDQAGCDSLADDILSAYNAYLSAESSTTKLVVTQNFGGTFLQVESTSSHGVGTRHLDLSPPQVQGLIRKVTGEVGRANRGRTFVGDVPRDGISDAGQLLSGEQTALQTLADAIAAALGSGNGLVDDHYLLHADGSAPTLVTNMVAEGTVATLRRRLPR